MSPSAENRHSSVKPADSDEGTERPTLNLSRLGRRAPAKKEPVNLTKTKRKRPSERYESPPIPSSFVDDATARFDCCFSNSSPDEETLPKPRRQKSDAEILAIRQKLDLCKAALSRGTCMMIAPAATTSNATGFSSTDSSPNADSPTFEPVPAAFQKSALRSSSSSSDNEDDDNELLKPNFIFANRRDVPSDTAAIASSKTHSATTLQSSSFQCHTEPPVVHENLDDETRRNDAVPDFGAHDAFNGMTKGKNDTVDDESKRLLEAVTACYQLSDPTVCTTADIVAAVGARLGLPQICKEQKKLIKVHLQSLLEGSKRKHQQRHTLDASQPEIHALQSVVDEIFAMTAAREGLQTCTFKQFLVAAQAKFSVPFDKECKSNVKKRVTYLLKNHGRSTNKPIQATSPCTDPIVRSQSRPPCADANKESVRLEMTKFVLEKDGSACALRPIEPRTKCAISEPASNQGLAPIAEEGAMDERKATIEVVDVPVLRAKECCVRLSSPPSTLGTNVANINNPKATKGTMPLKDDAVAESMVTEDAVNFEMPNVDATAVVVTKRGGGRRKHPLPVATAKASKDIAVLCEQDRSTHTCGRKQGRPTCTLCSKCPCQSKLRDSSGSAASLDFAQSDAAIEKALIKRLLKLEATTDQYDEQTDAVRRRLKKHRRDMWKNRVDLLKAYDDLAVKRKSGERSSRFLPDVDEYQQLQENQSRRKRLRTQSSAKVQANVFAVKPTIQPTLTQMMGAGKDTLNGPASPEAMYARAEDGIEPSADVSAEESDSDSRRTHNDDGSDAEAKVSETYVKAHRVVSKDPASITGSGLEVTEDRMSIWEAVRSGNYESSWDQLFQEKTAELGVDHLLGLLGDLSQEKEDAPSPSQSSLSTRARSLADAVTDRICSNSAKLEAVQRVCPNWRENVIYAMGQRDESDVSNALTNVQEAQARLQHVKEEIVKNIDRQEAVLSVFEETLQQSLIRFAPSIEMPNHEGFFLSQVERSPTTISYVEGKVRKGIDCEIGTLNSSPPPPEKVEKASGQDAAMLVEELLNELAQNT